MSFWSGEKIAAVAQQHPSLISEFDSTQVDCNAYTLKMGHEYFVTADRYGAADAYSRKERLTVGESFIIPPGQFAFLLTKESIEVPSDVMAFISMKATYKFQGLINVSGFHVDPGYRGNLVFGVYNAGSLPVHLTEGLPLFLIWFADLDRISSKSRQKNSGKSLSNDLLKGMSGRILSLQSLSDEIEKVRSDMTVQRRLFWWGVGIASAVLGSLLVGSLLFFVEQDLQSARSATPTVVVTAPAKPVGTSHHP